MRMSPCECRKVYPVFPRYILWIMMEIAIIGSDIQEVHVQTSVMAYHSLGLILQLSVPEHLAGRVPSRSRSNGVQDVTKPSVFVLLVS